MHISRLKTDVPFLMSKGGGDGSLTVCVYWWKRPYNLHNAEQNARLILKPLYFHWPYAIDIYKAFTHE